MMKNMMLVIGLVIGSFAGQAQALTGDISCRERLFGGFWLIDIDLKKNEFVVREEGDLGLGSGKGQIGEPLVLEGNIQYPLYENSKSVGYLTIYVTEPTPAGAYRAVLSYQGVGGRLYCQENR